MSDALDRAMAFSTKERLRRCFNISEITEEALLVMHDEIERLTQRLAAAEARIHRLRELLARIETAAMDAAIDDEAQAAGGCDGCP